MAVEEIGRRVYAIRLALGDGWKNPMSQADFGALLTKRAGRTFDSAMVSRMENGDRTVSIEEAVIIAALDPKKRGFTWLAVGEADPAPSPAYGVPDTRTPAGMAGGLDVGELRPAKPMPRSEKPVATPPVPAPVQEPAGGPAGRGGPKGRQ